MSQPCCVVSSSALPSCRGAAIARLLLLAAFAAMPAAAQDVFLSGANLVDPSAGEVRRANLLIREGVIAGFPEVAPEDFDGQVLDVSGYWIIPGLHDLHVHSFGNSGLGDSNEFLGTPATARRALYAGVTGVLDLFNMEDAIFFLRNRQRADRSAVPGADIFASGPCLTATDGHCSEYGVPTRLVDTPADARRVVAELAPKQPDVVKLVFHRDSRMPTVDIPTLQAVIAAAREHDLLTVVHIGSWDDALEAVAAGATAITHSPDGEAAPVPGELVELMKERGAAIIPTLTVHCDLPNFIGDSERLDRPLLRAVASEALLDGYRAAELDDRLERRLDRARRGKAVRLNAVKTLHDAGVSVLTGTDAGNPGVFQAYSVHRELALLVEAGLDPFEALAASTSAAGDFLGKRWGLSPGDEGSVVVLEASPVQNIANTERILRVIHHGVVIDREALIGR